MPENRYTVFDSEMVDDDIKDDLNKIHFYNKFVKTGVVEGFHEEVRNRVDKFINEYVFHSFVQNGPVLKKLLFVSVSFFKNVSEKRITQIKLFYFVACEDVDLKTVQLVMV